MCVHEFKILPSHLTKTNSNTCTKTKILTDKLNYSISYLLFIRSQLHRKRFCLWVTWNWFFWCSWWIKEAALIISMYMGSRTYWSMKRGILFSNTTWSIIYLTIKISSKVSHESKTVPINIHGRLNWHIKISIWV